MQTLRIAIIGCGAIAEKHVSSIAELGAEASIAALCDISAERMNAFAIRNGVGRFPGASLYTDVDEMLERPDVDLVVVASSSDSHAGLVMRALRAGKHVLVEKPLALSLREAQEAASEARSRGLVLAVSFQVRYLPQIAAMKAAVQEGRFGSIGHGAITMRWNRDMAYYRGGPWREDWSRGGGLFMNQCIHYVDLLIWLMGPVKSAYALASVNGQPIGVENIGAALLRFESGAIGIIEASAGIYPKSLGTTISLFGSKGSASVEGTSLQAVPVWQFADADAAAQPPMPQAAGSITHTPLYRDLMSSIRGGQEPLVAADRTFGALETVLAIYQSIASGTVVTLPADDDFHMGQMAWKEGKL